jgi:hypothetical protein
MKHPRPTGSRVKKDAPGPPLSLVRGFPAHHPQQRHRIDLAEQHRQLFDRAWRRFNAKRDPEDIDNIRVSNGSCPLSTRSIS